MEFSFFCDAKKSLPDSNIKKYKRTTPQCLLVLRSCLFISATMYVLSKEFAQGVLHACYGDKFDFVLLGVDCLHVGFGQEEAAEA